MGLQAPEECGYNWVYAHKFCLNTHGVPGTLIELMNHVCQSKWGWHFVAHDDMNYARDDWYENQTAYISFEDPIDLANVILTAEL